MKYAAAVGIFVGGLMELNHVDHRSVAVVILIGVIISLIDYMAKRG